MSKAKQNPAGTPIEVLLADGTVTLTADSREAIYAQAQELVAAIPDGTTWQRTGVCFDGKGAFTQTYSISKD